MLPCIVNNKCQYFYHQSSIAFDSKSSFVSDDVTSMFMCCSGTMRKYVKSILHYLWETSEEFYYLKVRILDENVSFLTHDITSCSASWSITRNT